MAHLFQTLSDYVIQFLTSAMTFLLANEMCEVFVPRHAWVAMLMIMIINDQLMGWQ